MFSRAHVDLIRAFSHVPVLEKDRHKRLRPWFTSRNFTCRIYVFKVCSSPPTSDCGKNVIQCQLICRSCVARVFEMKSPCL